jgi:acylphosphatase
MAGDRKQAKRWLVSGQVQGVGYRAFAQHKAMSLGVTGWARNLEDGRVEVFGVGTPDRLDDLAAALHVGPRMSDVRGVEEQQAAPEKFSGFSVR